MPIPKAAVISDLSGLGKCSLTAAIPLFSAMGVQACPLPTGVLSNQTAFDSFACVDLTAHLASFADEWAKLNVKPDAICTGYFCDIGGVAFAADFIRRFRTPETVVLIDPVLGDNGAPYPAVDPRMYGAMKTLLSQATVITPNFTEACILTGHDIRTPATLSSALEMARTLAQCGPSTVVITGVPNDGEMVNALYEGGENLICVGNRKIGTHSYSGTGDCLASILCAGLVRKMRAQDTLALASRFLEAAIAQAEQDGDDPRHGIALEQSISILIEGVAR